VPRNYEINALGSSLEELDPLDPIHQFELFCRRHLCWDVSVALDLLISTETCFLLYLLRLLKYTKRRQQVNNALIHQSYVMIKTMCFPF